MPPRPAEPHFGGSGARRSGTEILATAQPNRPTSVTAPASEADKRLQEFLGGLSGDERQLVSNALTVFKMTPVRQPQTALTQSSWLTVLPRCVGPPRGGHQVRRNAGHRPGDHGTVAGAVQLPLQLCDTFSSGRFCTTASKGPPVKV